MKCCTEISDLSRSKQIMTMTRERAIEVIKQKIQLIAPERQLTSDIWQFWVEKLVFDVLDYCHRDDFPDALIYTCVDLVLKRLSDAEAAAENIESDTTVLPLSEIKMDDTSFKFYTGSIKSTTAPDNVGLLSDLDFDSIKPRLNLYRKVVSR